MKKKGDLGWKEKKDQYVLSNPLVATMTVKGSNDLEAPNHKVRNICKCLVLWVNKLLYTS
jgi:hypothetical protein